MKRVRIIDKEGNGTTNQELLQEAERLKLHNFRGVFMIDELIKLKPLRHECGIVNLEPSSKGGSHWVCWWIKGDEKYFFDSFGAPPDKRILKYMKKIDKNKILFSTYQIQNFNDTVCGQWCLFVLNRLNLGQDYMDIIAEILKKYKLY